ncbi:branched-chain amino acid transporter permease [uncultured Dubosiella sp.]|uniref:branched-chain amino acid transporter permease n=1 Tax=uncultured Dubosiella sp. TaxID=1937011 RepID=UPI002731493B|nr:branched-chain amino acid transporter permease [uncultured Dubosiella sp.]
MNELVLIGVIALVTFGTRALPFVVFKNQKSPFIAYLGDVLPFSIMAMLVVYCLKEVDLLRGNHGICEIIGVASVVLIHLWKRNTLLSILAGTLIYMACVQVLFA